MRLLSLSLGATVAMAGCSTSSTDPAPSRNALLPLESVNRGTANVPLPDSQTYQVIDATDPGPGVVALEGVGRLGQFTLGNPTSANESRLVLHGTIDQETGGVTVTDTKVVLVDTDGASAPFAFSTTDATAPTSYLAFDSSLMAASGNYQYARLFHWEGRDEDGLVSNGRVMLGVATDPGDIPTSGSVSYTGDSLLVFTGTGVETYQRGSATVDAHFDTGLVDATMNVSHGTLLTGAQVTGMEIEGNGFSGGTVTILNGTTDVTADVTGGVTGMDASGVFFGPTGEGPAEVGGVASVGGNDANLDFFFIAEQDPI